MLESFAISNFMSIRSLHLSWAEQSLVLVAGPNEIGKTSVKEALTFCLFDDCARLESKGQRNELVTRGEKRGVLSATFQDGARLSRAVNTGKTDLVVAGDTPPPVLDEMLIRVLLDPESFVRMDGTERRRLLLKAMRVSISPASIVDKLLKRKHPQELVELLKVPLASGFDKAVAFCKSKESEARGEWKAITGETYGSAKADTWGAGVVIDKAGEADIADLDTKIAALREKFGPKREQLGAITEAERQQEERATKYEDAIDFVAEHKATEKNGAKKAEKWQEESDELRVQVSKISDKILELDAQIGDIFTPAIKPAVTVYACPECGTAVVLKDGALIHYAREEEFAPEAEETPAQRKARINMEIDLLDRDRIAKLQDANNLAASSRALLSHLTTIAEYRAEVLAGVDKPNGDQLRVDLKEMTDEGTRLSAERAALYEKTDGRRKLFDAAKKATAAHTTLQQWQSISEAVSPDGIPTELLATAINPLNEHLDRSAKATGWPLVRIDANMAIFYGEYGARMGSESGQWRAAAMLGAALAALSGLKILCLDRLDMLDIPSRTVAIQWLLELANSGDLHTGLILSTMKGPAKIPGIECHWLGE